MQLQRLQGLGSCPPWMMHYSRHMMAIFRFLFLKTDGCDSVVKWGKFPLPNSNYNSNYILIVTTSKALVSNSKPCYY